MQGSWISRQIRTGVSLMARPLLQGMTGVSESVQTATAFVTDYHAARTEAAALRRQLALAESERKAAVRLRAENERLRRMMHFAAEESRLELLPVRVRIIGNMQGTLTIDRGVRDGVRAGMCAVDHQGHIVGVVAQAEAAQAYIYTVYHSNCRIPAQVERTGAHGVVSGSGSDFSPMCRLAYLDPIEEVREGDEVVTSSDSDMFPPGYRIGVVAGAPEGDGTILQTAPVRPGADPYRLREVFLVERRELAPQTMAAGIETPRGQPMPDQRSLQERYAP
jgi:rod shape-determining protein MreC